MVKTLKFFLIFLVVWCVFVFPSKAKCEQHKVDVWKQNTTTESLHNGNCAVCGEYVVEAHSGITETNHNCLICGVIYHYNTVPLKITYKGESTTSIKSVCVYEECQSRKKIENCSHEDVKITEKTEKMHRIECNTCGVDFYQLHFGGNHENEGVCIICKTVYQTHCIDTITFTTDTNNHIYKCTYFLCDYVFKKPHIKKAILSSDESNHWYECEEEKCFEKLEQEKHSFVEENETKNMICKDCDYKDKNHKASEEWTVDANKHYKKCIVEGCDQKFEEGEHVGGTHENKGVCSECEKKYQTHSKDKYNFDYDEDGHTYGCSYEGCEEVFEEEHDIKTKYSCNDDKHWYTCSNSKCKQKFKEAAHTDEKDNNGICDDCKRKFKDIKIEKFYIKGLEEEYIVLKKNEVRILELEYFPEYISAAIFDWEMVGDESIATLVVDDEGLGYGVITAGNKRGETFLVIAYDDKSLIIRIYVDMEPPKDPSENTGSNNSSGSTGSTGSNNSSGNTGSNNSSGTTGSTGSNNSSGNSGSTSSSGTSGSTNLDWKKDKEFHWLTPRQKGQMRHNFDSNGKCTVCDYTKEEKEDCDHQGRTREFVKIEGKNKHIVKCGKCGYQITIEDCGPEIPCICKDNTTEIDTETGLKIAQKVYYVEEGEGVIIEPEIIHQGTIGFEWTMSTISNPNYDPNNPLSSRYKIFSSGGEPSNDGTISFWYENRTFRAKLNDSDRTYLSGEVMVTIKLKDSNGQSDTETIKLVKNGPPRSYCQAYIENSYIYLQEEEKVLDLLIKTKYNDFSYEDIKAIRSEESQNGRSKEESDFPLYKVDRESVKVHSSRENILKIIGEPEILENDDGTFEGYRVKIKVDAKDIGRSDITVNFTTDYTFNKHKTVTKERVYTIPVNIVGSKEEADSMNDALNSELSPSGTVQGGEDEEGSNISSLIMGISGLLALLVIAVIGSKMMSR